MAEPYRLIAGVSLSHLALRLYHWHDEKEPAAHPQTVGALWLGLED